MASAKLTAALGRASDDAKMDMSPMIDMVFLLLIFFMVASRMITVRTDSEVKPPVADMSKVAEDDRGRILFNIRADGTFTAGDGSVTVSQEEITERVVRWRQLMEQRGLKPVLLLRAHRDATVRDVKKVTKAAADGGISAVVFGAYKTDS